MLISAELTATSTEQKKIVPMKRIVYIINDGNDDILVGDSPTNVDFSVINNPDIKSYMRIKPGEILNNLDIKIDVLYFKSILGSQPFRIGGISR